MLPFACHSVLERLPEAFLEPGLEVLGIRVLVLVLLPWVLHLVLLEVRSWDACRELLVPGIQLVLLLLHQQVLVLHHHRYAERAYP